jgi:Tol biopolymer transport system component
MAASSLKKHEFTGDGNSSPTWSHPGGRFAFTRHDDTGTTGTTKLQFQIEGQDNWQDIPDTTLTQSDGLDVTWTKCQLRVNLASHSGNSIFCSYQFFA